MQQSEKQIGWQSFVSLNWYAGLISFIFRFVAMTSEPLLALGVILSAADFLQQGHLMAHNPTLMAAWAWAQALAIEASTGPTLAFALAAFRSRDTIKGILYSALAALLFIVGGAMLFLQLVSNVTGSSEVAVTPWVLYTLLALRVLVASGIVALLCTKHMRFSGLTSESPASPVVTPTPITPHLEELLDRLDARSQQRMQAILEHTLERTVETVRFTIEQVTSPQLPAVAASGLAIEAPASDQEPGAQDGLENLESICEEVKQPQPIFIGRFASKEQEVVRALQHSPSLTAEELGQLCGCSVRTAAKWAAKYKEQAS